MREKIPYNGVTTGHIFGVMRRKKYPKMMNLQKIAFYRESLCYKIPSKK